MAKSRSKTSVSATGGWWRDATASGFARRAPRRADGAELPSGGAVAARDALGVPRSRPATGRFSGFVILFYCFVSFFLYLILAGRLRAGYIIVSRIIN